MPTREGLQIIRIAVCDSSRMGTQLLAEVLARDERFSVVQIHDPEDVVIAEVDAALISANIDGEPMKGCELAKQFRAAHPESQVIMLIETVARNAVLEIFRSGARGIFCRAGDLSALSKCIKAVNGGQVWAGNPEIQFLIEAVEEPVKLRLVDTKGKVLLSNREQEVARWVVEGLSNREIALRMNLSEHTVKNYLFRIFDKLGISNRVELILYAFSQLAPASPQTPDKMPALDAAIALSGWCHTEVGECAIAPLALAEMYNEGSKVPRDCTTAFMWFTIANRLASDIANRSTAARTTLRREMSPEHIAKAESRAAEWINTRARDKEMPEKTLVREKEQLEKSLSATAASSSQLTLTSSKPRKGGPRKESVAS